MRKQQVFENNVNGNISILSVITEDCVSERGDIVCETFGVSMTKKDEDHNIYNITTNYEKIMSLLNLIHRNDVDPIHLEEIVMDFIA